MSDAYCCGINAQCPYGGGAAGTSDGGTCIVDCEAVCDALECRMVGVLVREDHAGREAVSGQVGQHP